MVDNSGTTRISLRKGAAISTFTKILALTTKLWCTCICSWTKLIKVDGLQAIYGPFQLFQRFQIYFKLQMQAILSKRKKKKKK